MPPSRPSSPAAATSKEEVALIVGIDHFVLTVASLDATCAFYQRVLGFERVDTPGRPTALAFGSQKINVHEISRTFEPKAKSPTPGSGDFCLITERPLDEFLAVLEANQVMVELGPVERIGAQGPMMSVYFRDPDGNLVEVSQYPR
ncbi:MAG: VOC family protein [Mesorhizobium sp.]|nr:MAG: VOC family protein [Mesorhizobium sp.]